MSSPSRYKPESLARHGGYRPESDHGACAVPIYQTTSYAFESVESAASLFNLECGGHIYSRISNPTVAALEQRLAVLEGASGAVCTASGMAALFVGFITLCSQGDHIIASQQLYGSTATALSHTLKRFGIDCDFVPINDAQAVEAAIKPSTKVIFCESISNPGMEIADLPMLATLGRTHGIPLMVDATFATPALCRPIEHGANIVVHSITKWIGGHGTAIGGVIMDGGNFDWSLSDRFSELTTPYPPFHGLNFWEEFGPSALAMKIRAEAMRDLGATLAPHNAFLVLQGLETLHLRMQQHVKNTHDLRDWLLQQKAVRWVRHPALDNNPSYHLADKLFPNGAGASLCFGVYGGHAGGVAFIEALELSIHLANVGDNRTLVLHPASTTHSRLSADAMQASSISDDLIRVSVGLENIQDLKADFTKGLKAAENIP